VSYEVPSPKERKAFFAFVRGAIYDNIGAHHDVCRADHGEDGLDTPADCAFPDQQRGLVEVAAIMRKVETLLNEDWLSGTPDGAARWPSL